jgi:hypothetical protein
MEEVKCKHRWTMIHVRTGYIITENCFQCNETATYFCSEDNPPLEEHREGDHFWNVMESAQSIQFDLECDLCHTIVSFKELAGLMLCPGCNENCKIDKLRKGFEKDRTWVYIACGFLPVGEVKRLSQEKISILEEYFNQRRKSSNSGIKIISYEMIDDIKNCYAEVIKDVGMLNLRATE